MPWGFYGRNRELSDVAQILSRRRWFFAKMTGRRRIGKTTLIQHAIQASVRAQVYYVQIPDSGPAGVLSAVGDALASFRVPAEQFPRPRTLGEFAKLIASLVRANYVVVLDEFQYFNLRRYCPFAHFCRPKWTRCQHRPSKCPVD